MRNSVRIYGIPVVVILGLLTGCGPTLDQVMDKLSEAKEHQISLGELGADKIEPVKYKTAEEELADAEDSLEKGRLSNAYNYASRSLSKFLEISKKYYLERIRKLAEKAQKELEQKTKDDPDSVLKDFAPRLTQILAKADKIERGQLDVSLDEVIDDLDELVQIADNIQENVSKTVESDVSFGSGEYHLSQEGKQILRVFLQRIIEREREYIEAYPDKTITVKVKVVGYTDQVGFREGTSLVKRLTEGVETEAPVQKIDRRQFLNRRLSEFRAKTISDFITDFIAEHDRSNNAWVHIDKEIIGRGEEIPPTVNKPYPLSDPRRRICKIYTYVTAN